MVSHKNKYQQYCVKSFHSLYAFKPTVEEIRKVPPKYEFMANIWSYHFIAAQNISVAFLNGDFTIIVIES